MGVIAGPIYSKSRPFCLNLKDFDSAHGFVQNIYQRSCLSSGRESYSFAIFIHCASLAIRNFYYWFWAFMFLFRNVVFKTEIKILLCWAPEPGCFPFVTKKGASRALRLCASYSEIEYCHRVHQKHAYFASNVFYNLFGYRNPKSVPRGNKPSFY